MRQCNQCHRRLLAGEVEICRLCESWWQGSLEAHEAMYGDEEREMAEARLERYEDERDNRRREDDE